MADELEFRIARLNMEPGDILVVKMNEEVPYVDLRQLTARFKEMAPENGLLLISGDVELSLLKPAEVAPAE